MTDWNTTAHHDRLAAERRGLVDFATASRLPEGGFGWLDATGALAQRRPIATWINARMTHVFSLAHGFGDADTAALADHGVAALTGPLHDDEHGGWYSSTDDSSKGAYEHAFVVLAAASATAMGRPGAEELLTEALHTVETHFWDEQAGLSRESWDREWTSTEAYRGANSNMHLVEAFLAAGDVTGDPTWHRRALRIAEYLVHTVAAAHHWRLPEHFTPDWQPLPDYNHDQPQHPFRPHGSTPGHGLEWARLLIHLEATLGTGAPDWLLDDARHLFDAAVDHGWNADGHPGFVYTLDWQDRPQVRARMHWVIAEAILTASTLYHRTNEDRYARWYDTFWDYARTHHVDPGNGSWHHELTPGGQPASSVWSGKPDAYHAYQAALLPVLPLAPAPAALARKR
ncbi:mannose/cellobiose epimerase-like protein (N-acyl-D-glucosamine 2-epimerase family) [Saccharopolyspora lacisalsi]|uniref:Mannose/cellobiose epimerase-like protein (N-acyl-D-glucosamine 2-epimerase family) n=1 Tax=Halosaccharopolyspora lacisalsi TaxID=1000566 RepID=A0A839E013_9PSEU|nr:AGE family epimerase/isomerase [Halosaccharopolyspora lacisalsi]MBA8826440.1 mannose/cellobiose epimerase-like protein (N-acyl-D-glucosamine 2-epimerase family) [Halosaccharopolyspora lacisalsi]